MRTTLSALLLLLLGACTSPYRTGEVLPEGRSFPGLHALSEGPLDVIAVHGMCTHDKTWVYASAREMSDYLGLSYTKPDHSWKEVQGLQIWKNELKATTGETAVTHYAIVWSPLTAGYKSRLCYDSGMVTKSCTEHGNRKQASLNRQAKSNLMNDCLSDAIIYSGAAQKTILEAMREALRLVGEDRRAAGHPAAIISESLGSKIIVDAVDPSAVGASEQAVLALVDTRMIYMAANQIPLLDLGDDATPSALSSGGSLDILRQAILELNGQNEMSAVQAVAFTDPNDLLSYELPEGNAVDATVRITVTPVVLGLFANPWEAHIGYLEKTRVWKYIVCGSDLDCAE